MSQQNPVPTNETARRIVAERLGWREPEIRRFTTGIAFFVYDVRQGAEQAVVRIGRREQGLALAESLALWRRLTPLGVPLPRILVDGTTAELPFVIMERLPGTDLGHVMAGLPASRLTAIAHAVADAQRATMRLGPGKGFGYAVRAEAAPHKSWGDVVAAHIDRSSRRIAVNGLFPTNVTAGVLARLAVYRTALDTMPPTPFLHDTTTKNVIVTPTGDFSGIVDVDDLCFGDPRYTPALTKAALLAFGGGPVDYVEPWLQHMGLRDDDVFAFYVAAFLLDFISEQGMVFNGNQPPSDPALRERVVKLLAQVLGSTA